MINILFDLIVDYYYSPPPTFSVVFLLAASMIIMGRHPIHIRAVAGSRMSQL